MRGSGKCHFKALSATFIFGHVLISEMRESLLCSICARNGRIIFAMMIPVNTFLANKGSLLNCLVKLIQGSEF
jgi:hypothetical protein